MGRYNSTRFTHIDLISGSDKQDFLYCCILILFILFSSCLVLEILVLCRLPINENNKKAKTEVSCFTNAYCNCEVEARRSIGVLLAWQHVRTKFLVFIFWFVCSGFVVRKCFGCIK